MPPLIKRLGRFVVGHLDQPLLTFMLLLMITGLLVLYSAANGNWARVNGQMLNMLVALGVLWVFANIPPHYLKRLSVPVYVVGLVLLVGVAIGVPGLQRPKKAREILDCECQGERTGYDVKPPQEQHRGGNQRPIE